MNLEKLFKMQKELDERILDRFPELRNENLLDKKILALQVELGELAQNWRGFKYWSEDQKSNTKMVDMVNTRPGSVKYKYPLLEEYADGLHFILSIGNDLGITHEDICIEDDLTGEDVTETFNLLFCYVTELLNELNTDYPSTLETRGYLERAYHDIFECFVGLGESQLGFTWEQIEQAYFAKNEENHRRQENGY